MFIDATLKRNRRLIETSFKLHREKKIRPDTYVIDMDAVIENARCIKKEADKYGIKLYFMTKQLGRNYYVASKLMELGYEGAVAVDYKEAQVLYKNGIKIGHIGHLVQVPSGLIEEVIKMRPEVITVYSVEKAKEISIAAQKQNVIQKIMLRVIDENDILYDAQYGGFYLENIIQSAENIKKMPNIQIAGVTSFPCFLYNDEKKLIKETNNIRTLLKSREMLKEKLDIDLEQINTPSATCSVNIQNIVEFSGTHGEPGHGLLGTTPMHAHMDLCEKPAVVYVSEVSHNLDEKCYIYGGGYYPRSHMKKALIGKSLDNVKLFYTEELSNESIDYYIGLNGNAKVGDTAVLSFRTQIFVTRSDVAIVEGISRGEPNIVGIFDSQGRKLGDEING